MATTTTTKAATKTKATAPYVARLKDLYNTQYAAELQKELGLSNPMLVPRLEKIVVNVGLGRAKDDKKILETDRKSVV